MQAGANLQPVWERAFPEGIHAATLASNGNCAAVTTNGNLIVIGRNGSELWRWNFSESNRFIVANAVAVSPKCDWAAFTGDSGYRYVWIVPQRGTRTPLQFRSTPQAVAISHNGDRLAVGTAGNEIRMYSRQGLLLWTRAEGSIVDALLFSSDDRSVMTTRPAAGVVLSINGDVHWRFGLWVGGMQSSRDLKTFLTWTSPPHGPGIPLVSLIDEKQAVLWTRQAGLDPRGAISPSGDLVAFRLNDDQILNPAEGFIDDQRLNRLALLSRTGTMVKKLSGEGYPIVFSASGRLLLLNRGTSIDAVDLQDQPVWTISSATPGTLYPSPEVWTTPDLGTILVKDENLVRWYSPPTVPN